MTHVETKMASLQKVLFLSLPKRGLLGLPILLDSRVLLCRHATSCIFGRKRLIFHPESWPRPYVNATEPVTERMMPFEKYRKLRKALKWRARIAGIPMGFLGIATSSYVNVHFNPDMFAMSPEEIKPILGMDPIVFAALCGVGTGVVGFVMGGALFSATWKLLARKTAREMQVREDDFLQRLQKHRFSAFNRYEDDYYGDKILTPSDYRQWIRVQQRKRDAAAKFIPQEGSKGSTQTSDTEDKSQAH